LTLEDSDLYTVTEALLCGNNILPSDNLYPREDGIHITDKAKLWIVEKLSELSFPDPEFVFESYFKSEGLIYSINKENIGGIETYLKIVALMEIFGCYTKEEYNYLKLISNEVYYNHGYHGKDSIDNSGIDVVKLDMLLNEFEDIYTTNYDTILDDFLEPHGRFPYHLHGGFSIDHKNKDPDGRYSPTKAKLIWGRKAEEKFEDLKVSIDFSDINFEHFRFDQSRLADYFDYLQNNNYDEINIFGFSGENDDHINKRIIENPYIKKVIWYVNKDDLNKRETQVKSRLLFGGKMKNVILSTWDDFWDRVKY
jgi:hypothetical protein